VSYQDLVALSRYSDGIELLNSIDFVCMVSKWYDSAPCEGSLQLSLTSLYCSISHTCDLYGREGKNR
jgi:hypothetical protein